MTSRFQQARRAAIKKFNKSAERDAFVAQQLSKLSPGIKILDAGAGSQPFKPLCSHLEYYAQDVGGFSIDANKGLASRDESYVFGSIDYLGDVWSIDEVDGYFEAILCTEVLEHIPYAVETIKEFFRLLAPGGKLILTAPGNSVRHFDPYYFVSGYSDHWFRRVLTDAGFNLLSLDFVGDYYSWNKIEMYRTIRSHGPLALIVLFPALLYFWTRKPNAISRATITQGYHIVAEKPSQ